MPVYKTRMSRVPTGIPELDDALSGGFPARSMILLGGGPGSGKTIFGMTFLANGAEMFGEKGLYISFSEGKETMYAEMKELGINLLKLENAKKFWFEEMMTVSGAAMGDILGQVVTTISKNGIKRVVLDSITAVAQSFEHEYQARQILHTVLSKLVRNLGCTTLVISERLSVSPLDYHFEEFVADGILGLKAGPPRELEIRKMRGTKLSKRNFICTIDGGFRVLKTEIKSPTRPKIWKPIPNVDGRMSSGSEDLDSVLKGGFQLGSYVVFEADSAVSIAEIRLFTAGMTLNAVALGQGALGLPSAGTSPVEFFEQNQKFLRPDNLKLWRAARVVPTDVESSGLEPILPHLILLKGGEANFEADTRTLFKTISELKQLTNNKPVLRIVFYDALETEYATLHNEIVLAITRTRISGDVTIGIARPSLGILLKLLDMVDWHFRLSKVHGTLLFQGIKPETPLYAVQCDISKGFPMAKLTEVT